MDFDKVQSIVKKVLKDIDYSAIYLFGSYANGDFTEDSDIDIGLLLRREIEPLLRIELQDTLETELKKEVDLVTLNLEEDGNYLLLGSIIKGCLIDSKEDIIDYLYRTFKIDEIEFCEYLMFGDEINE